MLKQSTFRFQLTNFTCHKARVRLSSYCFQKLPLSIIWNKEVELNCEKMITVVVHRLLNKRCNKSDALFAEDSNLVFRVAKYSVTLKKRVLIWHLFYSLFTFTKIFASKILDPSLKFAVGVFIQFWVGFFFSFVMRFFKSQILSILKP